MSWADVSGTNKTTEKVPYTKFPNGATKIRILDAEPYSFWQHWLPDQGTSVSCMGKDCPICNVNAQAKSANEKTKFGNSQRHALRIWNYTTNQMEIMIQGKTFFNSLLTLHREVGDLREYDVKAIRGGSGTDTNYTILPSQPAPFEHEAECVAVDMADLFKAPEKDIMIKLMEGQTWTDIYGTENAA